MTITVIETNERTPTYEGGSFVQWADNTNAKKISFVSAWNFTPSMDEFEISRIDSAKPIFTPITDIKGTFSFNIKNAISLYDTAKPPTDALSLSKWIIDIQDGNPPEIIFAPVMKAKVVSSLPVNPFINLIFTGRVMNIPIDQILDQDILDVEISGEITNIDQIRRENTANNEG